MKQCYSTVVLLLCILNQNTVFSQQENTTPNEQITVAKTDAVLYGSGNQYNYEGDKVSLQLMASDPNNNDLTYSATNLPPSLSIDPNSGLISGSLQQKGGSFIENDGLVVIEAESTDLKPHSWFDIT